jgi:multiple sugar transport system substrate-binding protein
MVHKRCISFLLKISSFFNSEGEGIFVSLKKTRLWVGQNLQNHGFVSIFHYSTIVFMKRYFYLFFLSLFLLSSCTKNSSSGGNQTIKFWHFWSEPSQKQALKDLVAEFEKQEHCTVELTDLSWNDGKTKLLAAFNSNTAPDVVELGSDWVAQFSSAGVLQELPNDSTFAKFAEFSRPPALWKSKVYAYPWNVDTRVMFCNTDLLSKAGVASIPTTVAELIVACEKLQSISGIYPLGANGDDRHRLYKKILPFFWSNGGDVIDANGKMTLNSAENIQGLNAYISLSRMGLIETQRQLDVSFVQGKVGFWFSGGWLLPKIAAGNPTLNYSVALVPGMKSAGISFAGGEYIALPSKGTNQALAAKFARFITDGKTTLEFCKKVSEAGFPADKRYFADSYFKQVKNRSVFAEQLTKAKMTPVHPKWLEIEALLENAVVEALYGRKSAASALNDAQAEAVGRYQ